MGIPLLTLSWYNNDMTNEKRTLLLVDGSSVAYRAFFALYQQIDRFKSPKGLHTNAIYGFHLMLNHLLDRVQPTHILVAFDAGKTTFRTALYKDYKAGRSQTPDEFREQLPFIRELLGYMGIPFYELDNYEADDIIGTLSKVAEESSESMDIVIVSGDKDLIQLANSHTRVEISKKGVAEFESFTPDYLMAKMGITPSQFIDLKALMGDKSDNIPGVTKIGEKTGLKLLHEYGSLENLYAHIDTLKASKMKENLIADKGQAFLSQELATIKREAPLTIGLSDTVYQEKETDKLLTFYEDLGFEQFKNQLLETIPSTFQEPVIYHEVTDLTPDMLEVNDFVYLEYLGDNYHQADPLVLAWGRLGTYYLADPVLLDSPIMKEFLANHPIKTYDSKALDILLRRRDIALGTVSFDTKLCQYLLTTMSDDRLSTIASAYTNHQLISDDVFYGIGKKRVIPDKDSLYQQVARKLAVLIDSQEYMCRQLAAQGQEALLYEMEQPLARILAKMEWAGIAVKQETLASMQMDIAQRLETLTREIYEEVGHDFNINSPKQLGLVLFEELKLPLEYTKKTKTGYSTAADVLDKLATISPFVDKILRYRQLSKLHATYLVSLQEAISADGKIHTRYLQDGTQTGRLSSVDPNLQNIPIRLEEGRLIRKAFVSSFEDGYLLSSDYSQIELRVMAHVTQDPHLIAAFQNGEDIHTATAMRVFGIASPEAVTANDRRHAKAVNFGVIYGISEFGLSNNLGISRQEAKAYIDSYMARFPGIKTYMEETIRESRDKGYVQTLYHRKRDLPDINARNAAVRQFAERTAINSPIQGSAADILKLAMIALDRALVAGNYRSRMLLQVHDEIVLEVPKEELDAVSRLVKDSMEQAASLSVPLEVDETVGRTWYDAK